MGLFGLFKQKPQRLAVQNQRIWLNKQAKLAGIAAEIERGAADSAKTASILLVAHFSDCFEELQSMIGGRQFNTRSVFVVLADSLVGQSARQSAFGESHSVRIIVAERHPLLSHDEAVLKFARDLPCACDVVNHISFDDAVMQIFAGEWVQGVLERLGMTENEAIESRMILRRIEQALLKVERSSTGDRPAESAEQWFEYNCRELWPNIDDES